MARRRLATAMAAMAAVTAAAALAGAPAAADHTTAAPDPGTPISVFARAPGLAIDAARVRLGLHVTEFPAGQVAAEAPACPLASAELLGRVGTSAGAANAVDLQLQLDPWQATTTAEPELRPSSAVAGTESGLPVVTCETARPDNGEQTRPALWALSLQGGVSFTDVARRFGVEPVLRVRPAGVGGEVAGTCQSSPATGVCVVLWQSRNLVFGLSLEGPSATVTPALPADVLTAALPGIIDAMAVRLQAAPTCSSEAISAETAVSLIESPVCNDGWAVGVAAPCPSTGCVEFEVFHADVDGWRHDGVVDARCAENFAVLGMTGVTAQKFVDACDTRARSLRGGSIRPGAEGQRVTALQVALVNLGYDVPIDGRYGPLTQAAVVHYQIRNELIVDGITGSQTQRSLGI